jgi:hypothetical protein
MCCVEGCGAPATQGVFCERCFEKIAAFERMCEEPDAARNLLAALRFRRIAQGVKKRLWVPQLIAVVALLIFFYFAWMGGLE